MMSRVRVSTLLIFGVLLFSLNCAHGHFDFRHHGHRRHHGGCNHNHDEATSINDTISIINNMYSVAGSSIRKFCEKNSEVTPKILYGEDAYIIKYELPNMKNLQIIVKAVNRLIITEVKEKDDFKGFQDVRILPEMLDLKNSFWSIEQSYLKIMLPYKVSITTEFNAVCQPDDGEVNIAGNLIPDNKLRSLG